MTREEKVDSHFGRCGPGAADHSFSLPLPPDHRCECGRAILDPATGMLTISFEPQPREGGGGHQATQS